MRLSTGKKSLQLLATALLCGLLTACTEQPDNSTPTPVGPQPPVTSQPMPPVSGNSIKTLGWELSDGRRDLFSAHKGKVLVLDFYATWCEPCRNSVPHLIELQKKFAPQGVSVIGLNVGGPEDLSRVSDFARQLGIQYSMGVPDDELVGLLLSGSDAIPQTFVFDRQGQLVERFIGYGPTTGDRITKAVEAAVQTSAD
jgi:cytochrome c biogenesis protein CcmG/thiol:disulfide interchange protein DsbE